jgi:hypothetical protein
MVGTSFTHKGEKFSNCFCITGRKGPSQPFIVKGVDKMSTTRIGRNSGVAVTINKGADDKAKP